MGSVEPTSEVLSTLQQLKTNVKNEKLSTRDRHLAYVEARAVMLALEDDGDVLNRLQWNVYETLALDIAGRMGLLAALVKSSKPRTATELATECKVEPLLTLRILRTLDAYGCVDSKAGDETAYMANNISRLATTERGEVHMRWCQGVISPLMFRLPAKLEEGGFKSLIAGQDTVFNDARGKPGLNWFQLLTPEEIASFSFWMQNYNLESVDWSTFYPVQERIIDGAKTEKDAVLFVDVGGSAGHQAAAFHRQNPSAPGRIVVQDRGAVLEGILPGLEPVEHDFLTPQPVKGARVYYLRHIMHDWNAETNAVILGHLRDAMQPGYSRVLIHEWLLPDRGASTVMTSLDLMLMTVLGGEERSLARHREYIEAAGLRITNVYDAKDGKSQAIIECERV